MEEIHYFGENQKLMGIFTPSSTSGKPIVILSNVGIHPRGGPFRINVHIARSLAAQGFSSFRFDLSGHGDSGQHTEISDVYKQRILDVKDALDYLEQFKSEKRFIIIGICSGAQLAHSVAARDERVRGVVLIDPYTHRSKKFYLHYVMGKMKDPGRVWHFLSRKAPAPEEALAENNLADEPILSKEDVAKELLVTQRRNMPIMLIYTGGYQYYYSYKKQFFDTYQIEEAQSQINIHWYKQADHLLSTPKYQDKLVKDTLAWAKQNEYYL